MAVLTRKKRETPPIRPIFDGEAQARSSLYEAFPPAEARRIAERLEWHYTPKHGSWLNMAEAELSIMARQCLDRRIPDVSTLEQQVTAWLHRRNKHHVKADWRFTTQDARIKLKNLYPVLLGDSDH